MSKDYLQGKSEKDKLYVHPEGWYDEHEVELRLNSVVTGVDRSSHEVSLEGGQRLHYDKLLLAPGSSPRRLTIPGADVDGLLYLRRLEDCEAMKAAFQAAHRVAIIGAGWIGLETAAAARAAGCDVTVIEVARLPLLAALGPEVAQIYAQVHRQHGVELRMGTGVAEIIRQGNRATGVRLADGVVVQADAVVVGVGIVPNTDVAARAGLDVDNGIVVDEHLASSDADLFAVGDVANAYYPHLGTHLRLEHWAAALNQGPVAAANMVGRVVAYDDVPYFYSDQYDLGMEYSGYVPSGGVRRGRISRDVAKGEFIAFWTKGRRVLAGMNVNVWDLTDAIQSLVRSGQPVDLVRLADPAVALDDLHGDDTAAGARR